jgi:hypothetical protein
MKHSASFNQAIPRYVIKIAKERPTQKKKCIKEQQLNSRNYLKREERCRINFWQVATETFRNVKENRKNSNFNSRNILANCI